MTHGLILVLLQLCNSRHTGMRISNFVFLSVITAPRNVPTPHISKTHLPIVSLNARELELNWCSKDQSRKQGAPPSYVVVEVQILSPQSLFKIC